MGDGKETVHRNTPKQQDEKKNNGLASLIPPGYMEAFDSAFEGITKPIEDLVEHVNSWQEFKQVLIEEHAKDPNKSKLTTAAHKNSHGIKTKTRKYHGKEKMLHFRIDWVRKLEQELTGKMTKTSAQFTVNNDQDLLFAIFYYQYLTFGKKKATGIIDAATRTSLEDSFTSLNSDPIGDNLESRTLIPAGATEEDKFQYYKSIIKKTGGIYNEGPHRTNLLAIKGVVIKDDGSMEQTDGAKNAKAKLDAGKQTNYFNAVGVKWEDGGRAPDDIIVSLWTDNDGKIHVEERIGTTEFGSIGNTTGGPTVRDGQYMYQIGKHKTSSANHAKNVKNTTGSSKSKSKRTEDEKEVHDILKPNKSGDTYKALVPHDKFEVWRSGSKKDKNLSQKDIDKSDKKIAEQDNNYIGRQGINFHTATATGVSSHGCQNIPIDEYKDFLQEILSNKEAHDKNAEELKAFMTSLGVSDEITNEVFQEKNTRYTIPYTLVDASKIDSGLVLVKTVEK